MVPERLVFGLQFPDKGTGSDFDGAEGQRPDTGGGVSYKLDHTWLVEEVRKAQEDNSRRLSFELLELPVALGNALESSGIIPRSEIPNPYYHPEELYQDQFDQWSEDHPEEMAQFSMEVYKREEIWKLLYLGACLRRLTVGKLYKGRYPPEELTEDTMLID